MALFSYKGDILVLIILAYASHVTALLCYSCQDVDRNEECLNVTMCRNNDVCFTRSDGFETGFVKHTLGCRSIQAFSTTKAPGRFTFCDHICQEDLCNLKMCNLQGKRSRPPRCLSCSYVKNPGECTNVELCSKEEICYVDEFISFGEARYRLGCIDKKNCENVQSPNLQQVAVGRRTVTSRDCSKCCTTDHCNDFICTNNIRDNDHVTSLRKTNIDVCEDSSPAICKGYGTLSKDSCKLDIVQKTCKKSCGICGFRQWSNWQPWSSCSRSCGPVGTRTRKRGCTYILAHLENISCSATSTETQECKINCPVNGGWCHKTEQYNCHDVGYNAIILCDDRAVQTTCNCPTPAYGGKPCH